MYCLQIVNTVIIIIIIILNTKTWKSESICMPSYNTKTSRWFFYTLSSTSSVSQQREKKVLWSLNVNCPVSHPAGTARLRLSWSSAALAAPCSASAQWRSWWSAQWWTGPLCAHLSCRVGKHRHWTSLCLLLQLQKNPKITHYIQQI